MKLITTTLLFTILSTSPATAGTAASPLTDGIDSLMNLRLNPVETIDRALIYLGDNGRGLHADREAIIDGTLLPYARRHHCSDSIMAILYDNLGLARSSQGKTRYTDARDTYLTVLDYADRAADTYRRGRVLERLALIEHNYGDIAEGFRCSEEAIKAYRHSGADVCDRIARCYYSQAAAYLRLSDMEGLRRVADRLDAFASTVTDGHHLIVHYNLYSILEAYYGFRLDNGLYTDRKALVDSLDRVSLASVRLIDTYAGDWATTSIDPAWNYYNRAVFFINNFDRPDIDSVNFYLDKAVAVDHKSKGNYDLEIEISAASVRAELWMKHNRYDRARDILIATVGRLDSITGINNSLVDKIEIYKNLHTIARESGHPYEALDYADTVARLEKLHYSTDNARAVKDLEIKYQTRETELALSQSETRRANTLMWLFAAMGLILAGSVVFMLYASRQRRRRQAWEKEFSDLRDDIGRRLTRQYVEGLESERRRMARELHDGVCNDLMAISMNIAAGSTTQDTAGLIDSCRESVRRISHELMPPEFSYATIDEVLRYYITRLSGSSNRPDVTLTYSSSSDGGDWAEVPDTVALELYRIVQESTGNALRHSGADTIEVMAVLSGNRITLDITDNGHYRPAAGKGIGIDSMRHRADSVNATLSIYGAEGGGTTIHLVVDFSTMKKSR